MNREQYVAILEIENAELRKRNKELQYQLDEKDRIINDGLIKIKHIYNMLNKYKESHIICFDKDLWKLYQRMDNELLSILKEEEKYNGK